jgi:hypothetical protein
MATPGPTLSGADDDGGGAPRGTTPTGATPAGTATATPTTTSTSSPASTIVTPNAGTTSSGAAGTSKLGSTDNIIGRRVYNPLSELSSYTYKIGLYFLDPVYFNAYMEGDQSAVKNFKLIAQSGGITKGVDSERAKGFDLDFYIDNLEMHTKTGVGSNQAVSNTIEFKFQVIEPYGFTFTNKIVEAAIGLQKDRLAMDPSAASDAIVSLKEHFFLMINFFGYDKDGKVVSGKDYPQADIKKTDEQAIFERGFPIVITKFNFRLENKSVIYNIEAKPVNLQAGLGTKLGTIKSPITIKGETVNDLLLGPNGLFTALNKAEELELQAENPKIEIKQTITAEFEKNSDIAEALIVPKDYYTKQKTPMFEVLSSEASNVRAEYLNKLGSIEKTQREIAIPAGMPIVQAIDLIITQSSYIRDALKASVIEENDTVKPGDPTYVPNSDVKKLSWFNVLPSVKINPKKDTKRNDYVYDITYNIQKYEIPYVRALTYGTTTKYYGPHKRYDYWYTGENTEITGYEQEYNLAYFNASVVSSKAATDNRDPAPQARMGSSEGDSTMRIPGSLEPENSIKAFLYSPKDQLHARIKILGDPDYLMEAVSGRLNDVYKKWYGDNFTINPNSGQVFIEIDFKQPVDYDLKTGLLETNDSIKFWDYPKALARQVKGMCYMLMEVTSRFSRGRFEQELRGVLPPLFTDIQSEEKPREETKPAEPERTPTAPTAPAASQADVRRSDNAIEERTARPAPIPISPLVANSMPGSTLLRQAGLPPIVGGTVSDDSARAGTPAPVSTTPPADAGRTETPTTNAQPRVLENLLGAGRVLQSQNIIDVSKLRR